MSWKPVLQRWRQLLGFALLFQTLEGFLFAPLLGLAGQTLAGRPAVDSTALVAFVLTPVGSLLLLLGAAAAVTIRLVEHAGLSVIVLGALHGETIRVRAALRFTLLKLPQLTAMAALVIGAGALATAPLLAVAGGFAARLLPRHDINYYLTEWPPAFGWAALVTGVVAAATVASLAWGFVRWRLVVQAGVFEGRPGLAAFRAAALLSRGTWWRLAWRCLAVLGIQSALVLGAASLGQGTAWLVLGDEMGTLSLAVSCGALLVLRAVVSALVGSAGAVVEAGVITVFYQQMRRAAGGEPVDSAIARLAGFAAPIPRRARRLAALVAGGLCASEGVSVWAAARTLSDERPITVTAHRGSHGRAPENTAAAVREAIAVGAQLAEIDVQLSKDGVLVVTHDSDFSRMAGVSKKVWELTYAEIRAIPLGAKAAPEFRDEPAPRFDDVLVIAKDRLKLNLELKYYGNREPRLAERVVEAVRAAGMSNQVIIQCLEYEPLREVRRLAPEIPVGYLLSVNARHPARLEVDFLSATMSRANGAFVRAAHRRGQQVHVWTVDQPADMEKMIELGVDSLITNRPAEALRLVRAHASLGPAERTLLEIRAWLAP